MVKRAIVCIIAFCYSLLSIIGQENDSIAVISKITVADSLSINNQDTIFKNIQDSIPNAKQDTVAWVDQEIIIPEPALNIDVEKSFKPNPTKAVLYTALVPGLGQIYNRKYWKLPIVYGGVIGLVYAITWNGRLYGDYTTAYKAIMSGDPFSEENFNKWSVFFARPLEPTEVSDSQLKSYQSAFKNRRDVFRRNRDLSIIGIVGLYAICMIDAYVDAELFDFNISPDLTFQIAPRIGIDAFSQRSFGIQCNIIF